MVQQPLGTDTKGSALEMDPAYMLNTSDAWGWTKGRVALQDGQLLLKFQMFPKFH